MKLNWQITPDEIKQARVQYSKECPMLKHNLKQDALWKLYAIEKKSNQPGLVMNLVNTYTRDRISHKNKTESELSISQWASTSLLVNILTRNDKYKINIISAAIKTFFSRFNSKISFNAIEKTQDLAEPYAKYIYDVNLFINKLFINKYDKDNKLIVPFQIDLWIKPAQNSNDSDAESSEDDIDEYENEDQKINYDHANINIIDRLNANKIMFAQCKNTEKPKRIIQDLFEQLYGKNFIEFIPGNRFVIIVERNDISEYNENEYVMVSHSDAMEAVDVDSKDSNEMPTKLNETQYGDTLYLFMPNKGNKIPIKYCNETFLQLSCDCVLPAMDENGTITAQTASNNFFMISWHVKQMDEVSCYQYQRGQINKFIPSDMTNLWPYFFNSCGGLNNKFFEHTKDESNENDYVKKTKIIDNKFEHFCKIDSFGSVENDKQ